MGLSILILLPASGCKSDGRLPASPGVREMVALVLLWSLGNQGKGNLPMLRNTPYGNTGYGCGLGRTVVKGITLCGMNLVVLLAAVADSADWNTSRDCGAVPIVAPADGGTDPNAPDRLGRTPLHIAAEFFNMPAVFTTLIEAGADPNATDHFGETPLHTAATFTKVPAVITTLVEAGAAISTPNGLGRTPLHAAARQNRVAAIITTLIVAGADPNAPDHSGFTPLHMAAAYTRVPAVIFALVDGGADPVAKDEFGRTPLYLAREYNPIPGVIAALEVAAAGGCTHRWESGP